MHEHSPIEFPHQSPSGRTLAWPTAVLMQRLGLIGDAGPIRERGRAAVAPGSRWMLTGGTGWLGRHLAREILRNDPDATLLLPIRASTHSQAIHRARTALASSDSLNGEAIENTWWDRIQAQPITSLAHSSADGGLPRDLPPVDCVVHSAANMSLALNVDQAWEDNVVATQRVWQWAREHRVARFDHVSTLSVFVAGATPHGWIREDDALDRSRMLWGGYAASKWAAEAWLNAQQDGPALAVHRPGLISYSNTDGWAPGDGMAAVARAWKTWGKPDWAWPTGREYVDWSPADLVACGMLSAIDKGMTGALHWAACRSVSGHDLVDILQRLYPQEAKAWPKDDPLAKNGRRALGRWAARDKFEHKWWHDLFQSGKHRFHTGRSSAAYPQWDWSGQALRDALSRI